MGNIKRMKDKDGNYIYPVTHASAVFNDAGESVDERLQNINELIENGQMGGGVPNLDGYATKEYVDSEIDKVNDVNLDNVVKYSEMRNNQNNQGIQLNVEGLSNKDIIHTDANTTSYAILLNAASKNGKNLRISDNLVYSENADAIELNTPSDLSDGKDVFKNVLVTNNFVSTGVTATALTAGFAIGIAQTHNVVIANNVVDASRNEALHIEDATKNISVIGNVFDGNINNGCHLLYKARNDEEYTKATIVIGNHFTKQKDLEGTGRGIYRVYDSNGMTLANISNNRVEGFDVGIYLDGDKMANVDGCIIERCNVGISVAGTTLGTLMVSQTPTLAQFRANAQIESIFTPDIINAEDMFIFPSDTSSNIITLNKLGYRLNRVTGLSGNITTNIKVLPQPTYMDAVMQIYIPGSFNTRRMLKVHIEKGTDGVMAVTQTILKAKTTGTTTLKNLILEDGYLVVPVSTSSGTTVIAEPQIYIDGVIIF